MQTNYYYFKNGEMRGPSSANDLRELYRRGDIPPDTQICKEGTESWVSISFLDGIVAPPPIPKVPPLPALRTYEYSVIPFVAVIPHGKGADAAATQLEKVIQVYAERGWEYVRLESVETYIEGDGGCFGFNAAPARTTVYSMAVFKR